MAERVEFFCPLPPAMIRSNTRSHWGRRVGAKQDYSIAVWAQLVGSVRFNTRWERARATFTWKACHLPDQSNVLGNCKALLDILCMAPKSTQPNNTTYLGLIEDDKGVEAIGKVEKVAHRHLEGVEVVIERR